LTPTALKPQPSTSRAHMDICIAATEQTSGWSGSGQQGAGDTDDEMEYIMRDAPATSREPVIIMKDEPCVRDVCRKATYQTSGPSGSGERGAVDADVETEYVRSVEYEAYYKRADDTFHKIFVNNTFGHVCDVCTDTGLSSTRASSPYRKWPCSRKSSPMSVIDCLHSSCVLLAVRRSKQKRCRL
jgi:hypothetical protein